MDKQYYIKVTGAEPKELVKAAYNLSQPQGMGFMHFEHGSLTDEEAGELVNHDKQPTAEWPSAIVSMDYVKGRSCKFYVMKDINGDLWIKKNWYDHSETQLNKLLEIAGVEQ